MIYSIAVSPRAGKDAERLNGRLMEYDTAVAARFGDLLGHTLMSLTTNPLRGRPVGPTTREVNLPFGQGGYVIRYRVTSDRVIITRIWHGLEERR